MSRRKRPAIAERGEHVLKLGGEAYKMRPSHTAIVSIEGDTRRSIRSLAASANTGDLTLTEFGIVAGELIRAGADGDILIEAISNERLSELAFEAGIIGPTAALTLVLVDILTGGRSASGEAKAPAA